MDDFPDMDVTEKIPLEFDFGPDLAELTGNVTLSGTPTVTVSVLKGNDPSPDQIKNGAASVVGNVVVQPVQGRISKVQYAVVVVVQTSDPTTVLTLAGRLLVR